ncbi:MAG: hypothetical protein EOP34_07765 [Rickettsiales bacterium]|nr:MAG: hypothetical protein EOP34_07765 [Rickettsiales bacterium]
MKYIKLITKLSSLSRKFFETFKQTIEKISRFKIHSGSIKNIKCYKIKHLIVQPSDVFDGMIYIYKKKSYKSYTN